MKFKEVHQGARACGRETEFLQSIRKSNDLLSTPVMERKFS